MRLGLIIYGGLDTVSGGYLYDRKLVEHLEASGDEVEIISLPWRNYPGHILENFNCRLFRKLSEGNYDILLQDELNHPSLFWLNSRLPSQISYPIVSIVHHLRSSEESVSMFSALQHSVERSYLNSVDAFIYNSNITREVVEGLVSLSKPSVVAYPAGDRLAANVTEDQISQRAHQPGSLRLVFLGNVIPRKGLHTLLAALEKLPRSAWQLTVAGSLEIDEAYSTQMQEFSAAHDKGEQVHFMGSLHDEQLKELLMSSHVLAVPSSYEGFGIAYLEGMSFGLPALGSEAGGAVEIIHHGEDGYLIAPSDVGTLANHLQELSADREKLEKMSLAARQRFLRHPGWDESMGRIRAFLLDLI